MATAENEEGLRFQERCINNTKNMRDAMNRIRNGIELKLGEDSGLKASTDKDLNNQANDQQANQ
ncbi:MAG: hypothetical protein A3F18_05035 [Legionellales bacterium RIFCSPHIGHO2_12_FULL_37_14]|nr:MAG: hypothetical protein A3F18_05035 [Legionellales bacterium RIFCSPHIGHO2_12_FULL_37_14]